MTAALVHRGPDACGEWIGEHVALGHRRLSIIDLSDAGRQPMRDESGRFTLVYNGEIYNYVELRRELEARGCRFRSHTDSEVLLYAYREWGIDALSRFNGMWAFALWDDVRQELIAARDRAGKKPFYYTRDPSGTLFFASEVKSFLALGMKFGLDPQAAFDFLSQGTYGHLYARGFFAGVDQLPAAHWMQIRAGDVPVVRRYWELPVVRRRDRLPYDDRLRGQFRELVEDAVRVRLRADVPVGATLSGGLDSSAIVGLVDRLTGGAPLHIFTSLYPGSRHDETPYFEAVVSTLTNPVVHRVAPSGHMREDLVRVLDHQEEPFGDTSIVAHYRLMRAAREAGVPVVLSGQGGDELLFGYPSMVHAFIGDLLTRGHVARALHEINAWVAGSGITSKDVYRSAVMHALPLRLRDRIRGRYIRRASALVTPELRARVSMSRYDVDQRRDALDDYAAQVFTRFAIPHLVHYDDRNAMAFSIEGRMPFLDVRLVELMRSADYDALLSDGITKRILRDALDDVLPEAVRTRRDKVGFHTPLADWLRGEIGWIEAMTSPDRLSALGVVSEPVLRSHLAALRAGNDAAALLVWRSFVIHLWADRFDVTSPMSRTAVARPAA